MRTDDGRGGWHPEFRFAVRTRRVEETVLVEVEGELDLVSAPHLQERLRAAVRDQGTEIFLDLSKVGFVDLAGWSVVCEAAALLHARGEALTIVATSRRTRRLLEVVGLEPGIDLVGAAHLSHAGDGAPPDSS